MTDQSIDLRGMEKTPSTDAELIIGYFYGWYLKLNANKLFFHLNNFQLRIIDIRVGNHMLLH